MCACFIPGLMQWQLFCYNLPITLFAFKAHPAGEHLHPKAACCWTFTRRLAPGYKADVELKSAHSDASQGGHRVEMSVLQHVLYTFCSLQRETERGKRTQMRQGRSCTMSAENCEKALCVCVQIMKTPAALSYHGVGPMVSARVHDLDILWARTFQLFDLCSKVGLSQFLTSQQCSITACTFRLT